MNNNDINEINRLDFENILWVIFIVLSILNIVSDNYQKEYVVSGDNYYEDRANSISIFVLVIVLFIYLYFYNRNRIMYINKGDNVTINDMIKVLGSIFFVVGTLCLLYFLIYSDDNFIGSSKIKMEFINGLY